MGERDWGDTMEVAAGLVELAIILAPALVGLAVSIAVIIPRAPAERRRRVRRLLVGIPVGALVAIAGYAWMLHGAGDGWVLYAIPPAILSAVMLPTIVVAYLRAPAPGTA